MREGIGLFTGKRVDNNEWVEGYLFDDDLKHSDKMFIGAVVIEINEITGHALYEVIPETISEYTSRRDKNNNRIFEGHILQPPAWYTENESPCVCVFAEEHTVSDVIGFGLYQQVNDVLELVKSDEWDEFEIIGNIHDNPELLKGGVDNV